MNFLSLHYYERCVGKNGAVLLSSSEFVRVYYDSPCLLRNCLLLVYGGSFFYYLGFQIIF